MFQSAYSSTEQRELDYIRTCGECGIETIIDCILDREAPTLEDRFELQERLRIALSILSDLEAAEWAAKLCGNPGFEEWMDSND